MGLSIVISKKREREKLKLRKFSGFSQTLDLTRLGTLTDYH